MGALGKAGQARLVSKMTRAASIDPAHEKYAGAAIRQCCAVGSEQGAGKPGGRLRSGHATGLDGPDRKGSALHRTGLLSRSADSNIQRIGGPCAWAYSRWFESTGEPKKPRDSKSNSCGRTIRLLREESGH